MAVVSSLREPRRSCNPRGQHSPLLLLPPSTNHRQRFAIGLAFLVGVLCGRWGSPPTACWTTGATAATTETNHNNNNNNDNDNDRTSSVTHLADVLYRPTSHGDKATGRVIQKQQLVEPFAVPNLAGVSVATLLPRQTVELHDHRSMHEFFYVLEGAGEFFVCGNGNGNEKNGDSNKKNGNSDSNSNGSGGNGAGKGESTAGRGEWHRGVPGTLVHVAPRCAHGIAVPETNSGPLKMLVVGVTVGD